MEVKDKTAVVTGAGSGIGRAVALELLKRGAKVAAVDLRPEGLEALAAEVGDNGRLSTHTANVTDKARIAALPDEVAAALGTVDLVINCAGIIQPFVPFTELADDTIARIYDVNLMGTIHIVRAFLPGLMTRPRAHLVLISSMGGFLPFPKQSVYSSSKAAVKLLGDALYAETLDTNVSVSVVMPGAVATNIAANSGVSVPTPEGVEASALPADEAARIILDGVAADRLHILVGKDATMLWRLTRLMPARAIKTVQRKMKALGL